MSTASRPFEKLPRPVKRLVYYAFAVMGFLGVSFAVNPDRSMAQARLEAEERQARFLPISDPAVESSSKQVSPPQVTSSRPLLGTLTGSPYFIWVYAGPSGPLYTVANKSGQILVTEVDAEAVYQRVPDASVANLQLHPGVPGPLMLVDPARQ